MKGAPFPVAAFGFVLFFGGIFLLSNGVFALTRHVDWLRGLEVAAGVVCVLCGVLVGRSLRQRAAARNHH